MQVTNSNTANVNSTIGVGDSGASGSSGAQSFQSLLDQLNSYVDGTPSQQMEAEILGQLGLTQDEVNQMSPQDKAKVEEKIKELIKTETQAQQQAAQNPQHIETGQQGVQTPQQIEQAQQKTTQTLQQIQEARQASRSIPLI
jgi:hypothetical protein